jgi:NitT/TauT family transport system permease protein
LGDGCFAQDFFSLPVPLVDPLPGIALLPLAILWFGIGEAAIIFVIVHSVLWPVLLNVIGGYRSVPLIYIDIGRNIGLSKSRMALGVFLPASLPNILVGLRTGWARAWRALISAEMVFGATGLSGGLGWDIFKKRSFMDVPGLYATLAVIMLIGLVVETVFFKTVEEKTVKKWGMLQ